MVKLRRTRLARHVALMGKKKGMLERKIPLGRYKMCVDNFEMGLRYDGAMWTALICVD
jgi:hypothetical protein